jgi:hypothetical protein
MDIHVYLHPDDATRRTLAEVLGAVQQLTAQGVKQMATLDEVLTDVTDETTQIGSLSVLTAGLKQQLADALAGTTLPPAVQAKVDAVFAGVESNKAAVVKAINDNTPAAVVPVTPAP